MLFSIIAVVLLLGMALSPVFSALKLMGKLDVSWWTILSPWIIVLGFYIAIYTLALLFFIIVKVSNA